jgi:hypothetical protein
MEEVQVHLYIYELSFGLSKFILEKNFPGVLHKAIVLGGRKFWCGRDGVKSSEPGATPFGMPTIRKIMDISKS